MHLNPQQLLKFKRRIREKDRNAFLHCPDDIYRRPATPPSTAEVSMKHMKEEKVTKDEELPESATTTSATTPASSETETPTKSDDQVSVAISLVPTEKSGFPDYSKQWFKDKYLVLIDDYICLPCELWAKQPKISAEKHVMPFAEIVNALKGRKVIPNSAKSLILISPKHTMSTKELSIVQRHKLLIQRV